MKTTSLMLILTSVVILVACAENENKSDAYGNFEATEINISSESPGKIIYFDAEEGSKINRNEMIAVIDTSTLHLQRMEIYANINSIKASLQNANPEVAVYDSQIDYLKSEKARIKKLFESNAATEKQFDEIKSKLESTEKQKAALISKMSDANRSIYSKIEPLEVKLLQIDEMIEKSKIKSPINGNLIEKYMEESEIAKPNTTLAKVADLENVHLRAYISGKQLPEIKLNDEVEVKIDKGDGSKSYKGRISYISDKSEFTPKNIQTKEERINLVYEIKVTVKNDGDIKIGMPGEVNFGE